jgi:lipopolysaccharide cholinephosphotransferase
MTEAGPITTKGSFPAADMKKMMDVKFEDRTYKMMIGYDDYLRRNYGDYMKLPPEDQRTTHHFEAYWKD